MAYRYVLKSGFHQLTYAKVSPTIGITTIGKLILHNRHFHSQVGCKNGVSNNECVMLNVKMRQIIETFGRPIECNKSLSRVATFSNLI